MRALELVGECMMARLDAACLRPATEAHEMVGDFEAWLVVVQESQRRRARMQQAS